MRRSVVAAARHGDLCRQAVAIGFALGNACWYFDLCDDMLVPSPQKHDILTKAEKEVKEIEQQYALAW
jgi:hypothetical protein